MINSGTIRYFVQYGSGPYLKTVHIGSLSPTWIHCIKIIKIMILSVDSRLLFLHCSLMSVPLKGGNKTVFNIANFGGGRVYNIAVLHRECGSSGKTNRLIFAWFDDLHVFACLSPKFVCAFSSRIVSFICIWMQ